MPLDLGFHSFDVAVRILEEACFHKTPLYDFLDKNFGISKIDPLEQLGFYSTVGGMIRSAPLPPAPPPLSAGGQRPVRQRERVRARIFG